MFHNRALVEIRQTYQRIRIYVEGKNLNSREIEVFCERETDSPENDPKLRRFWIDFDRATKDRQ
jgi:hypothetical protein